MMSHGDLKNLEDEKRVLNGRMLRFPKYKELFPDDCEGPVLDDRNIEAITNLSQVVVNRHFRSYEDFDEFVQLGVCAVINTLSEGKYDKDKGSLKNYLYTAIRNACTNYVHHNKNFGREVISDTLPENSITDFDLLVVNNSVIDRFFKSVPEPYHVDAKTFLAYLKYKGFPIDADLTGVVIEEDSYKLNKVFIKFISYYRNMR